MKKLILVLTLSFALISNASAEDVFRISIGKDFKSYTQTDLQRRVWELERAVAQLQARVFELEAKPSAAPVADTWSCTINAMGEDFVGTGGSKAAAIGNVMEHCKKEAKDGFFCKNPKCEQ